MKEPKTSPRRLSAEVKRQKAFEMRLAGFSLRAIAQAVGVSVGMVHRYLMQIYSRYPADRETVELARRIELERLDRATVLVMERIAEGDLNAVDRLVRLADLRMRILGAYKVQLVDPGEPIQLVWPEAPVKP